MDSNFQMKYVPTFWQFFAVGIAEIPCVKFYFEILTNFANLAQVFLPPSPTPPQHIHTQPKLLSQGGQPGNV